jgi:methylenetetrahydrofolate reductase (NADPH)
MKVADILRFAHERGEPIFSFEFLPPKTEDGIRQLLETGEVLRPLGPTFVSVTYGAEGSTRQRTLELVTQLKREIEIEAVAHITCVDSSRQELEHVLDEIAGAGIQNVLALRGGSPQRDA